VIAGLIVAGTSPCARESPLPALIELQKVTRFHTGIFTCLQRAGRDIPQISNRLVERAPGPFDFIEGVLLDASPPHAHQVQANEGVAFRGETEGCHVAGYPGAAAYHDALTYAAKLVDYGAAAEEGAIADVHMPSHEHGVGDDDVVADVTVMGHVTTSHEKTVGAHLRRHTGFGRAVHSHMFSNHSMRADTDTGFRGGLESDVLGIAANDGEGMNHHALAEHATSADDGVGMDDTTGAKQRAFFDQRGGMNLSGGVGGQVILVAVSGCLVARILRKSLAEHNWPNRKLPLASA
jgi:hypothetical protein